MQKRVTARIFLRQRFRHKKAAEKSLRLGLYEPIKVFLGADQPGSGVLRKFLAGAIAGACGAVVGNPLDVIKLKAMANKGENRSIRQFMK